MSRLRAAVERARDTFLFYERSHRDKVTKGPPLTPDMRDSALRKAEANCQLANDMQAALDDEPFDVLALEKVQDYRFGSLIKGQHYAFARGLTINPTHLPAALDAMKKDGFELVAMFGEATSDKMGFMFRMVGPDPRVQELLEANNKLVEENRELKWMRASLEK